MERWREQERQKRARERGRVGEERQKDFTVCLTGRPEGHTHTHTHTHTYAHNHSHTESVLSVCALSAWLCGGG